jgi:uncharacterized protein (TIGR03790 family)
MSTWWKGLCAGIWLQGTVGSLLAGGSGLNVVVVVNQTSTNSVQLGNYYCERRQLPPQSLLRINWSGTNTDWTITDYTNVLLNPVLNFLASSQLTNQIDYVVLSMDIPYRVTASGSAAINSTTSALFYGFKADPNPPCSIAPGSTSLYAGSEDIFRSKAPISPSSNSFLVTMITASNLPLAKLVVDQGVLSDSSFPTETVYLSKSPDVDRNVRYVLFDNAIFNTRLRGNYSMQRTSNPVIDGLGVVSGFESGFSGYGGYTVGGASFVPGSIADNLTSFGGVLFADNGGQLNILGFLAAGAAGTYGTVDEPCNFLVKFPSPQVYFYQARGFSLGECYYLGVTNPYQGLLLGEPLAAPFAQPASGNWSVLPANALLRGTTNLSLTFSGSDATRPVGQVDLFVDGLWLRTVTNIPPSQNNTLGVTLNGHAFNYTVPAAATLTSIAADVVALLNNGSNATKVAAFGYGDRVELQSFDAGTPGAQIGLSASSSIGTAAALTTFINPSRTNFLDTVAQGIRSFQISGQALLSSSIQLIITQTNGTQTTVTVNNSGSQTLAQMTQALLDGVNTNSVLSQSDGVVASDLITFAASTIEEAQFNLQARTAGWNAAAIQANLTGSLTLTVSPSGNVNLDENVADLEPRNHFYVAAGGANLALTFPFNTTVWPDGFHELTAVAYEGTHVHTQKRVSQTVLIQNTPLSATFTTLVGDTDTAVEATMKFSVVANTGSVSRIELFSTGGSLGYVTGQSSAIFSVPGTNLDLGLHPFYGLVTDTSGNKYRTQTKWIRLIGAEPPFRIGIATPPPTIGWAATAGRSYDILSGTDPNATFQLRETLSPSNGVGLWIDTNASASPTFYRVRTSH